MNLTFKKTAFITVMILCMAPFISPPLALLLGFLIAQTTGHPFSHLNGKATGLLLKLSVVGLGFGMNLHHAMVAGREGLMFTVFSITTTLLLGGLLGRMLKVDRKTSFLISSGTAICGGSAIAAVAPLVSADEKQISMALGTVFILNSAALFIFPVAGEWLHMSQHQFGIWSAIAIHDTSSVVGAAAAFGQEALQTATTVKLERALWIIPLSIITLIGVRGDGRRISIPFFIGFFILAMCTATFTPQFKPWYELIVSLSKRGLTVTLFLIGSGLSLKTVKAVGVKPLIQGILLWVSIVVISLTAIMLF